MRAHWGLGSKVLTGIFIPDPARGDRGAGPAGQRASASAEVASRLLEVYYATDVRALLPAIRARTAVLHREADPATAFALGREAAALIPGATLIPLPGTSHLYYHGDWPAVLDAMLGFLGSRTARPRRRPRLTGREIEVADVDRRRAHQPAIATPPVRRAADRRGPRREHPAQAPGALAGPDRGLGDRAPAAPVAR